MGKSIDPNNYPVAKVTGLFIGNEADSFATQGVSTLHFDHEGIIGEPRLKRRGLLMPADVRTRGVRKGTVVPHQQHVSMIDGLSLSRIADGLGIDGAVTEKYHGMDRLSFVASSIGANIMTSQLDKQDLYEVPNGSVMGALDDSGYFTVGLQISRYNSPCINPGQMLAQRYPGAGDNMAAEFVRVAENCRGVVAGVYVAGSLSVGDTVVFVPRQTSK